MSVVYLVVPVALLIVVGMVIAFFRSVKQGQFDDLETPAIRMLFDDEAVKTKEELEELDDSSDSGSHS